MNLFHNECPTSSEYINVALRDYLASKKRSVFFGQNVISGSRVSGLGAQVEELSTVTCVNAPNSENTLFGFGFGMAMSGVDCIYLMKQHDFSLLGFDHLVNTRRLMLNRKPTSTFLIVMVVVDSGYEGPQSNLNNLDDLHSISGIKVNLIGDSLSVHHCFSKDMDFCEIIAVSQNSLKRPIQKADKGEIINGFNCESIVDILQDSNPILINFGLSTELFENTSETLKLQRFVFHSVRQVTINKQDNLNFAEKIATANRKIVVFDSSKSRNKVSEGFCLELEKKGISPLYLTRDDEDSWMRVSHDKFTVNEDLLNDYLLEPTRGKTKC